MAFFLSSFPRSLPLPLPLLLLCALSGPTPVGAQTTYAGKATYPLNQTCGSHCGGSFCKTVSTKPTCVFNRDSVVVNFTQEVAKLKCQSCTQDITDPRCTASALAAVVAQGSGVKAAYCTSSYLIIISGGSPIGTPSLTTIPNPPGSVDDSGTTCVTRAWSRGVNIFKVALSTKYTLLPTASRLNNANTAAFPGGPGDSGYLSSSTRGTYGLPTRGAVGVSVAGQSIFPVFNNRAELTPESCEVDYCNQHVGGGGGAPHLHGDPFGANCLYSASNYSSLSAHPPQIGWSFDGPSIYGRYLSTAAPGYSVALDDCGGHVHDSYPYHYHSQVKSAATDEGCVEKTVASGTEYAAFPPGVDQCWRGNISALSGFWDNSPSATNPCCGMTHYYVAPGITINGAGKLATTTTVQPSGTTVPLAAAAGSTSQSPLALVAAARPTASPLAAATLLATAAAAAAVVGGRRA